MTPGAFELVPLDCPSCGSAVEAEGEDIVFYCIACRNGYRFDDQAVELVPIDVRFVTAPNAPAERYFPFWALPANVKIGERRAAGGDPVGWISRFFAARGEGDPGERGGRGTFVVPAFRSSLVPILALTRAYTEAAPGLGEKLGERLVGGCYPVSDAEKLAHFAVIAAEVEKRDVLKRLTYEIEFAEPALVGVPFARHGDFWKDALFGLTA